MALTILSGIEADEFASCIQENNVNRLVRLPGVGKKTAERLVMEMKDRLKDWQAGMTRPAAASASQNHASAADEAVSALISLGYKPQEASRYVQSVAQDGMDSETIIRESLRASLR
jgi:Holliday junction DNA helicase RuvA